MEDILYEVKVDQNSIPEYKAGSKNIPFIFKQCRKCTIIYNPDIGHECEIEKPKSKEDIIKALFCCVVEGCGQCPYFDNKPGMRRMVNGEYTTVRCKTVLAEHAKHLFIDLKKEE